ncbi:hypothetical protein DQ04_00351030 [Trypanosoma grayi]|uniref:hypothetical protein n=1 Tax=Trypanosoma grayi TaxID=71804 RepID=UPI0004F42212|nr:hypothetical protein DQ04_00351030 [Trypanosoma grayi]KEG14666.1 hypothetical protein DQ04_00351030 [Trypanosoma grayi]
MARAGHVVLALLVLLFLTKVEAQNIPVLQYPTGLRRVMNCDKHAEVWIECDPKSYRTTVLIYAAPGLFVAGVFAIAISVYFVGKYVFNCCGGRKQTPGLCFPTPGYSAKYDKGDILRPLILTVIVFIMCMAACIWGCTSLTRLKRELNALRKLSDSAVSHVETANAELLAGMSVTLYNPSLDAMYVDSLIDLFAGDQNLPKTTVERVSDVSRMLDITIIALVNFAGRLIWLWYIVYILPAIVSFVGLIVAFGNYRRYAAMTIFTIMAVLGVVDWGFNGMFAASTFLMRESCFEISEWSDRRESVVKAVADCDDTTYNRYTPIFDDIILKQSQLTCEQFQPFCYDKNLLPNENAAQMKVFDCPESMSCSVVTDAELASWTRNSFLTAPQILQNPTASATATAEGYMCASVPVEQCTLTMCAQTCTKDGVLSSPGKAAKRAITAIQEVIRARMIVDTVERQLHSCDAVLSNVVPSLNPSCQAASNAMYNLMQSSGLMGLATIAALFAYAIGAKRFIPLDQAFITQSG